MSRATDSNLSQQTAERREFELPVLREEKVLQRIREFRNPRLDSVPSVTVTHQASPSGVPLWVAIDERGLPQLVAEDSIPEATVNDNDTPSGNQLYLYFDPKTGKPRFVNTTQNNAPAMFAIGSNDAVVVDDDDSPGSRLGAVAVNFDDSKTHEDEYLRANITGASIPFSGDVYVETVEGDFVRVVDEGGSPSGNALHFDDSKSSGSRLINKTQGDANSVIRVAEFRKGPRKPSALIQLGTGEDAIAVEPMQNPGNFARVGAVAVHIDDSKSDKDRWLRANLDSLTGVSGDLFVPTLNGLGIRIVDEGGSPSGNALHFDSQQSLGSRLRATLQDSTDKELHLSRVGSFVQVLDEP